MQSSLHYNGLVKMKYREELRSRNASKFVDYNFMK